jgi:hypothetical protein
MNLFFVKGGFPKDREKRRQRQLKNDALCVESGLPIETFGNDGVGGIWGDGIFIWGGQTRGSAPTETDFEIIFMRGNNGTLCIESGFPIGTLGNDEVGGI